MEKAAQNNNNDLTDNYSCAQDVGMEEGEMCRLLIQAQDQMVRAGQRFTEAVITGCRMLQVKE